MLQELTELETRIMHNRLDREQQIIAECIQYIRKCGVEVIVVHRAMELLRDGICKDIGQSLKIALSEV